ncbi:MAG: hypothetical protein IPO40_24625 [Fibrobacteres bacterium]|nr:hypothetical protein [Fibrobacterota bacterium]
MSKLPEIKINNFSGGISDDPREDNATKFQVAKHFDCFSNPTRLTPYRSLEADTNDGSTSDGMKQYFVKDFLYHSSSAKLFGLGQTGAGLTKIVQKADATTGNWSLPATSEGNGAVQNGCFIEYKDYLWGFQSTNSIFKYGLLSGSPSITNSASSTGTTISSVAQGLIFNDYLYLPYNNKIWRATDATTFSDAYLTLPSNFKITSLCNFGKYIAIGCAPVSTFNGVSKVFLWDGTSTEVQEAIDWGEGELRILETIEGYLVGITDRYLNNSVGAGRGSMIIQTYAGGVPQVVKEVFTQALTNKSIPLQKVVKNNRLFFAAKIMTNQAGTTYNEGIWSFGRKNVGYPFALNLDIAVDTTDGPVDTDGIQSIGSAGNFFFLTHSGDGGILKTNDSAVYTFSSTLETQILNFGDVDSDKTLLSLKVSFRKQASGESLIAKYRIDGATAWTTIGTYDTDDSLSHTFLGIEADGSAFASGREYEFQLLSTGGLEITGLVARATINDTP